MKQVPIRLKEELHKKLKVKCSAEEMSFNKVAVSLLENWIDGKISLRVDAKETPTIISHYSGKHTGPIDPSKVEPFDGGVFSRALDKKV